MIAGTWTAAYLMLTAAAGATGLPPDVEPFSKSKFEIPIKIVPSERAKIRSLELHCSRNQGKTWEQVATATPDQLSFPYTAPADGIYWFTVLVRDLKGKAEPPSPYGGPPGLKVLVDTEAPDVRIVAAERQGDVISVRWEVREEYPNLGSFRLEYKPGDGSADWTIVPSTQSLQGQATVRCATPALVRASIKDVADNFTRSKEVKVAGAAVVTAAAQSLDSTADSGPPHPLGGRTKPTLPPTPPVEGRDSIPPVPPVELTPPGAQEARPVQSAPGLTEASKPVIVPRDKQPAPLPPNGGEDLTPPPSGSSPREAATGVVAASTVEPKREPATMPLTPGPGPTEKEATAPAVQPVNNPQVTLEYQVDEFGPSGVGGVDLYMTQDNGRTWNPIAAKEGTPPPAAPPGQPSRRTLTVTLGADGSYGFAMVVRSGAGLSMPPPANGDPPQMRVELDTQLPKALLYGPEPSPGQRDSLVIRWKATDKNLGDRPVSLEWAEHPRGEWKPIGERQLPNTGSYTWRVEKSTPPKVYLRLTVRDTAGNVAVAETSKPLTVDLVMPKAHLVGVFRAGAQ